MAAAHPSSARELAIERGPGTATSRAGQPLQRRRSVRAACAQRSLSQRQQIGRRELAPARRAPLVVVVRHQQLVAERQHGGALREGRQHAEVAWDLGEPGDRKGDPRGHLESELVDEKTVSADASLVKDQAGS